LMMHLYILKNKENQNVIYQFQKYQPAGNSVVVKIVDEVVFLVVVPLHKPSGSSVISTQSGYPSQTCVRLRHLPIGFL
jgi:hypothetical protein